MRGVQCLSVLLVVLLTAGVASAYMSEGTSQGSVIVVGEDRIAVQTQEGGQITFEVAQIKDGEEMVKNKAQMTQIKALKVGDVVKVRWGKDHAEHYYIVELAQQGKPPAARNGVVQGKVVTTGEGRIVIAMDDGAQMTLEPTWIRRNGKWQRDPDQEMFASHCKAGDEIVALWMLDEGTHYVMRGVARLDGPGQAASLALTQAQLREAYQQINQLQDQVQALRGMVEQLVKAVQESKPKPE